MKNWTIWNYFASAEAFLKKISLTVEYDKNIKMKKFVVLTIFFNFQKNGIFL
jgi:hypothetical protein